MYRHVIHKKKYLFNVNYLGECRQICDSKETNSKNHPILNRYFNTTLPECEVKVYCPHSASSVKL